MFLLKKREQLLSCIAGEEEFGAISRELSNQPDLERIFSQRGNNVFEEDLGRQGVTVVHDGLPVAAVPAVHLHTAAASLQGSAVCKCSKQSRSVAAITVLFG